MRYRRPTFRIPAPVAGRTCAGPRGWAGPGSAQGPAGPLPATWAGAPTFQRFFSDPELQALIGSIGAAPAPPEMIVADAVASPDQY